MPSRCSRAVIRGLGFAVRREDAAVAYACVLVDDGLVDAGVLADTDARAIGGLVGRQGLRRLVVIAP